MKTKVYQILTSLPAALLLLSACSLPAEAASTSTPAPEPRDSVVEKATLSLIESVEVLSKTASQLSEVITRWNEDVPEPRKNTPAKKTTPEQASKQTTALRQSLTDAAAISETEHFEAFTEDSDNGVFISDTLGSVSTDAGSAASASITRETIVYVQPEDRAGGSYIWVPDSLAGNVDAIMASQGSAFSAENSATGLEPNLNEMVNWRGTKIPLALPTKRLGRYDRKLYNWLIYPKGLWHIGLTANYGELDTENSELLSLMKEIDIKGKIYSIKPSVSYFIRNNASVGIRLAFTKGDLGINSFKVDIDEDMNFNLHDIKYTSDSYSAAIFYQQYFGLSRRGRFAVFNEAELSVGTGSTHFIRPFDGETRDTRTKTQSVNLNYSPGVSIMMMKNAAFNLSFGIFGFRLKTEKQWENGEECGSRTTSGINFRFNIFNINFGVAIII